MVKKELSRKAKLSISQSIYVPTLTYGHELWVVTERTRLRIQADKMSFLRRVSGLSLRDRVRSSVTREGLRVEPLLLRVERSQLKSLCLECLLDTSHWEEAPGKTQDTLEGLSRLAWECLRVPQEELVEVAGEREVWASLLRLLPPRPDPRRRGR